MESRREDIYTPAAGCASSMDGVDEEGCGRGEEMVCGALEGAGGDGDDVGRGVFAAFGRAVC